MIPCLPILTLSLAAAGMSFRAPAQDPVSLEPLRSRTVYSSLDEEAVQALARAAAAHWQQAFAGFDPKGLELFSAGGASHWISLWTHRASGLDFALVPGGRFLMGSPKDEADRGDDEVLHWVTLDPFLICRTECTQGGWAEFASAAGVDGSGFEDSPDLPIVGMSPEHVERWCREAGLVLPTEAQWEFMCRAGTGTPWASGAKEGTLQGYANIASAECPESWRTEAGRTVTWRDGFGAEAAPVGQFAANAFGLLDVHGNVREWCRDKYAGYAVPAEVGTGLRPGMSGERVARGGDFGSNAALSRAAQRFKGGKGTSPGTHEVLGFRPALDLPFAPSLEGWPEETFGLPPAFAPDLPQGTESLRFAPGWRRPEAVDFWSYAYVLWIDEPAPDADRVLEILDGYYDGLMDSFAKGAGRDIGGDPAELELVRTLPHQLEAMLYVTDAFATFEPVDVRVLVDVVPEDGDRSSLRVRLSPQPASHPIWRSLEQAIADIRRP